MVFCENAAQTGHKANEAEAPASWPGLGNPSPLGALLARLLLGSRVAAKGFGSRSVCEELGDFWMVSGDVIWGPGSLERATTWKLLCLWPAAHTVAGKALVPSGGFYFWPFVLLVLKARLLICA